MKKWFNDYGSVVKFIAEIIVILAFVWTISSGYTVLRRDVDAANIKIDTHISQSDSTKAMLIAIDAKVETIIDIFKREE